MRRGLKDPPLRRFMNSIVPSLSTQGWLSTIGEKTDRIIGYFFANEYSQSVSYYGHIASLQYLIAMYKSYIIELKEAIHNTLNKLLSVYFESVQVEVKIEPDKDKESNYTIFMSARIIDNGQSYQARRLIDVKYSIVLKISKIAEG